jgi:hypothetical protein
MTVMSFDKRLDGPVTGTPTPAGAVPEGPDPKAGEGETPPDDEPDGKGEKPDGKMKREEMEKLQKKLSSAASFEDWVRNKDRGAMERTFQATGAKGRKLPQGLTYKLWEYQDNRPTTLGQKLPFVQLVAVFDLPEREVAFLASLPEAGIKKFRPLITSAFNSVRPAKDERNDGDDDDDDLYKYAQTPERRAAVDKAKQGIAGFDNWKIYVTPSYICVYSFTEPRKEKKAREFAAALTDKLEKMREIYKRDFPPYEGMAEPYSVFRVCTKKEEFDQYGGTSGGVVGWFNPGTKELVVFNGKTTMPGMTEAVTFHEGWHQYCDSYFGFELQRWFDEGHGDYFGSLNLVGNTWNYVTSKMRKQGLLNQVRDESFVPIKDIVKWNKDKFYTAKAVTYYEQAYGIIDFLRRGSRFPGWQKQWDEIIPTYVKTARETQDASKAVDAAFAGVDMDAFEQVWVNYCKKEL